LNAGRALFESVFSDSVYPRRPTGADYERLTPHDAQDWVERAYQPGNSVAVVVNDLELSEAETLARNAFGPWKGSSAPPDAPFVAPEMNVGPIRTFRIDRPASKQTELLIGCAARPKDAGDAVALRLLSARLRTRLSTFARERCGGTYGIHGYSRLSRH
jgi:predicted Zn-dependent peptidase